MNINSEQMMRVIFENKAQKIEFQFYSATTIAGLSTTELTTYKSVIPKDTTVATYEHRPDIKFDALILVREEWEDIAYFSLDGEVICKRSAYGEPMISRNDELFIQSPYKQAIEDELKAEKNGREVIVSELTEKGAGDLMSDFTTYWEEYKKENPLE